MSKINNKSAKSTGPVTYPMSALHCKELFDQLRLTTKKSKTQLDIEYGDLFNLAPPTIRAWRGGQAKPQTLEVIKKLALDGMTKADMSTEWLSNFLNALDASSLLDGIFRELPPKAEQPSASKRFPIRSAWGALVHPLGNLDAVLREVEIHCNQPVVMFLGGASNMSEMELNRVESWIAGTLAPFWDKHVITIIDGATDAGIVAKLGEVYRRTGATFPLIGVVTHSVVQWPGKSRARPTDVHLEPNHTQFLLTPGNKWEDGSVWMARIGRAVAGEKRAVAVLVNGGLVAWKDAMCCLQAGIPVIAVRDSGRTADDLADAAQFGGVDSLLVSGAVQVVSISKPEETREALETFLG